MKKVNLDIGPFCPCCGTGAHGLEILIDFFDTLDPIYGFKGRSVQEDLQEWSNTIKNKDKDYLKNIKFFRKLPEGAFNLEVFNINNLNKKTKSNINILSEKYSIEWTNSFQYSITQNFKIRHGYVIKGILKNKIVEYWRLETGSEIAGQTLLYFDNNKSIRPFILINNIRGNKLNSKEQKKYIDWLNFLS